MCVIKSSESTHSFLFQINWNLCNLFAIISTFSTFGATTVTIVWIHVRRHRLALTEEVAAIFGHKSLKQWNFGALFFSRAWQLLLSLCILGALMYSKCPTVLDTGPVKMLVVFKPTKRTYTRKYWLCNAASCFRNGKFLLIIKADTWDTVARRRWIHDIFLRICTQSHSFTRSDPPTLPFASVFIIVSVQELECSLNSWERMCVCRSFLTRDGRM